MKRRAIVVLTVCAMFFSTFPLTDSVVMPVSAEEKYVFPTSGICGDNVEWILEDDGTLIISGTGDMYYYCAMDAGIALGGPWEHAAVRKVVIKEGVTSVGGGAFADHSALTSVILPDSIKKIKYRAFFGCGSLQTISISKNVEEIDSPFNGCLSLKEIQVDPENSFYYSADGALISREEAGLIQYPLGKEATSYVVPDGIRRIYDGVFGGCETLQHITLPASLEYYSPYGNFENCPNLVSIDVAPDDKAYKSSDGVLFSKDGKELIQYPAAKEGSYIVPYGTETINSYAFFESRISNIQLPDSITSIETSAFEGCSNLEEIVIPVNTERVGDHFLCDCEALRSVIFMGTDCIITSTTATICNKLDSEWYEVTGSHAVSSYSGILSGPLGSTAQRYALDQGYPFYVIGTDTPFDPYDGFPVVYKRSSDQTEVTDDGRHLRCSIYNVWGNEIRDIDPEQEIQRKITVNFHVSGIGTDSVDLSEDGTGMPLAVYLCGMIGAESYFYSDQTKESFPDTQVAMIHGDGNYSVSWYVESPSDSISCLYLDSNIDVFYYGAVDTSLVNSGCKAAINVDSIYIDGYDAPDGDVNYDGAFTISDVVLLQKWLLAVPDTHLSNWKAADLCEDGKLDVFDLCLMKRLLLDSQ